jgi:hypothetical protein
MDHQKTIFPEFTRETKNDFVKVSIALGSIAVVLYSSAIAMIVVLPTACDYPYLFLSYSVISRYIIISMVLYILVAASFLVLSLDNKHRLSNSKRYHRILCVSVFTIIIIPPMFGSLSVINMILLFPTTPDQLEKQYNICAKRKDPIYYAPPQQSTSQEPPKQTKSSLKEFKFARTPPVQPAR